MGEHFNIPGLLTGEPPPYQATLPDCGQCH